MQIPQALPSRHPWVCLRPPREPPGEAGVLGGGRKNPRSWRKHLVSVSSSAASFWVTSVNHLSPLSLSFLISKIRILSYQWKIVKVQSRYLLTVKCYSIYLSSQTHLPALEIAWSFFWGNCSSLFLTLICGPKGLDILQDISYLSGHRNWSKDKHFSPLSYLWLYNKPPQT